MGCQVSTPRAVVPAHYGENGQYAQPQNPHNNYPSNKPQLPDPTTIPRIPTPSQYAQPPPYMQPAQTTQPPRNVSPPKKNSINKVLSLVVDPVVIQKPTPPPAPQPAPQAEKPVPIISNQNQAPAVNPPKTNPIQPQVNNNSRRNSLPDYRKFQFVKEGGAQLEGKHNIQSCREQLKPQLHAIDCHADFGVVSGYISPTDWVCFTDGRYNMLDFYIEYGNYGGFKAYKCYEPKRKFTDFLVCRHFLCFRFEQKQALKFMKVEDDYITDLVELQEKDINVGGDYTLVPQTNISETVKPIIYVILPKGTELTAYSPLSKQAVGATIFKDNNIRIEQVKYTVNSQPTIPESFNWGPNSWENVYSTNRHIVRAAIGDKELIFCGVNDNKEIRLFVVENSRYAVSEYPLECPDKYVFASACADQKYIYYFIIQSEPSTDKQGTRIMYFIKGDHQGNTINKKVVPTGKPHLNLHTFKTCIVVLNPTKKQIGMHVTKIMTMTDDGLNHQSAIVVVLSTETLQIVNVVAQASSHSFGNSLTYRASDDKFVGMDLGDGAPRGVNHWLFDAKDYKNKVVYTFKTEHADHPNNPTGKIFPQYPEASRGGKKYYKWSNDNKTYTELAAPGVIEVADGTLIFFAGENIPNPTDCSVVGNYWNCSRNIGFVKISKDMETVLSKGPEVKTGYFIMWGDWWTQSYKGVNFLTNHTGELNASRVKACLFGKKIFVMYEVWTKTNYMKTHYMILDHNGNVLVGDTELDVKLRLHKADDIHYDAKANSIIIYAGETKNLLIRYEITEI